MSQERATLDFSGYLQVSKDSFAAPRGIVHYVELHGTLLYYWTEKPRNGATPLPVSVFNIDGAEVEESPASKLAIVVRGPKLARPVTFTCSADREKNDWLQKLRHPVLAHSKVMDVQHSQEEQEQQQEDDQSTIYVKKGHKKVCLADFDLIQVLGEGAFGRVLQVKKKDTGEQFAMKMMNKKLMQESSSSTQLPVERSILETINHPFIVSLHYAFQTDENLYIVMDLLAGGELFFHLEQCGTFDEIRARFYTAEIGLAIGYLHSKNIIYRDLKPENVVLDAAGHACLTDFGLAKANIGSGSTANTFCGTAEYQAPEFLLGDPHGRAVDWWSLGIMLYEMLFGIPPFYDENTTVMSELILEGELTFDKNGMHVSAEAQDLITRLLDRNKDNRMQTIEEFKMHPFFTGIDFDKLYRREIQPPFTPDPETVNNFNSDFTGQPVPIEEHHSDKVHPNVAGFTYDRSAEVASAPPPAASQQQQQLQRRNSSDRRSSNTSNTLQAPVMSSGRKGTGSMSGSSTSSSPKHKPGSPTGKKSASPPPHLVTKVPPKRRD